MSDFGALLLFLAAAGLACVWLVHRGHLAITLRRRPEPRPELVARTGVRSIGKEAKP